MSQPRATTTTTSADEASAARDAGRAPRIDAGGPRALADATPPSTAEAGPSTPDAAGPGSTPTPTPAAGPGFPAITDAWAKGPFEVATGSRAGPAKNANLVYPRDLGKGGLKHPIVIFDNGAGQTGTSIYTSITQHLASHGFAVYHAYESTDDGKEILEGLDWMIAENARAGGMFFDKLDVSKTAAMGHSRGSIATFAVAADPRLTTTIHLSGGTNPEIAMGHATLAQPAQPSGVSVRRARRRRPGLRRHRVGVVPVRLRARDGARVSHADHGREPHQRAGHDDRRLRWLAALAADGRQLDEGHVRRP